MLRCVPRIAVVLPFVVWIACSPDLAARRCETDEDCEADELCNAGKLCERRPTSVSCDASADCGMDLSIDVGGDRPGDVTDVLEDESTDLVDSGIDTGGEDAEEDVADTGDGGETTDVADVTDAVELSDQSDSDGDIDDEEAPTGCGPCLDGVWEDSPDGGEPVCVDFTPPNGCDGCATLVARPNSSCGECSDGMWTCVGTEDLFCLNPSRLNECGGCGVLTHEIHEECGCEGSEATWECIDDGSAVDCMGDEELNECGGCEELEHAVDETCSCGGMGVSTYFCDTLDSLGCMDGDDERGTPRMFAGSRRVTDPDQPSVAGWIDEPGDVDWFELDWLNDNSGFSPFHVGATLTVAEHADIDYEVCLFYRPFDLGSCDAFLQPCNLARNLYTCEQGSSCAVYRGAPDNDVAPLVEDGTGACVGRGDFVHAEDMYGCCTTDPGGDNTWVVEIANMEKPDPDENNHKIDGEPFVRIRPTRNDIEGGCHQYSIQITAEIEEP